MNIFLNTLIIISFCCQKFISGTCLETTLEDCVYGDRGPFEIVRWIEEKNCQKFCNEIFPGKCHFYIYEKTQKFCKFFDYPAMNFTQNCNQIGGSKYPNILSCFSDPNPCRVRTASAIQFGKKIFFFNFFFDLLKLLLKI